MKEIQLTQGYIAIIDDEDFDRVMSVGKWQTLKAGNTIYATHCSKRAPKQLLLHRFIMNAPKGMVCDHINHNTLDNRKANLRLCSTSQNLMNSEASKNNRLGIKNISLTKDNTYLVSIWKNKKSVFNKRFKTLEDAIQARDEQLKIHHGEYANYE